MKSYNSIFTPKSEIIQLSFFKSKTAVKISSFFIIRQMRNDQPGQPCLIFVQHHIRDYTDRFSNLSFIICRLFLSLPPSAALSSPFWHAIIRATVFLSNCWFFATCLMNSVMPTTTDYFRLISVENSIEADWARIDGVSLFAISIWYIYILAHLRHTPRNIIYPSATSVMRVVVGRARHWRETMRMCWHASSLKHQCRTTKDCA